MSNNIKKISVKKDFSLLPPSKDNVITPDFLFVTDSDKAGRMFVQTFQPYQLSEGRFIRVIGGKARLLANLKMYDLYCGTVVCLPPAAIIEYQSISDDFKIQAFSYDTMPQPFGFDKVTVLRLMETDFVRTGDYINLMKKVLGKDTYSIRTLQLLQTALFNDLHHIQNIEIQDKTPDLKSTRAEDVFNRFIDLVNEFGSQHRRIDFYADKLFLSPNRLSTVIKNYSGQTVMDWINRQTILQAKILLKHSDLMVYEIANRLHFQESTAFVRFFKNQTGMTPKEYQGARRRLRP